MPRDTRIADRLRSFGLTVVEVADWKTRGDGSFSPHGTVCHHTAGPSTGEIRELGTLINGRADLPGPLCHVGLARSGACYVVAGGRANHAGAGGWRGLKGNSSVFGIEAVNDGVQPWPGPQLAAYVKCAAALLSLCPIVDPELVCGHKEWAPGRKPDPHSIDMPNFRQLVRAALGHDPQPGGFLMALTDDEQKDLLKKVRDSDARTTNIQNVVAKLDQLLPNLAAAIAHELNSAGGGSGPSEAQIEAAVTRALNKTKLSAT